LSPSTASEPEADPTTANGPVDDSDATAPWPAAEPWETQDSEPETDLGRTCLPGGAREANLPAAIGKYLVIGLRLVWGILGHRRNRSGDMLGRFIFIDFRHLASLPNAIITF
jgi:hypothetical protein